jgi:hypothetical protein
MLDFVKRAFRGGINALLWINLILCTSGGGVAGYYIGRLIDYRNRNAGGYVFGGVIIGIIWGLLTDIVGGGFITTILSIEKNTEEQTVLLKKHLGINDIPVDITIKAGQVGSKYEVIKYTALRSAPDHDTIEKKLLNVGDTVIFSKSSLLDKEWFYVKSSDGNEGWCFSAYLKKC